MNRKNVLISRRDAVKELVKSYAIEDQGALIELLNKYYGIETNQPAISRDLHELGVCKAMVDGKLVYELPDSNIEYELLKNAIKDVVHNESMIVVKTVSGLAAFVGDVLDRRDDIGVLGTLAGENMVFVAPASVTAINEVFDAVCQALYFKKEVKT
jgi:transcriptional regulator of arginine metabolism